MKNTEYYTLARQQRRAPARGVTLPRFAFAALRALARSPLPGAWRLRHVLGDRQRLHFPAGPVRVRLALGGAVWVLPNDLIGRCLFLNGVWEGSVAAHFHGLVRPGDRVLDVGANVGQYTVLASRRVGPGGKVYAVEPNPRMLELLRATVRDNGTDNVQVLECAAWDEDTTLFLEVCEADNAGGAFTSPTPLQGPAEAGLPARRLDRVLGDLGCDRLDVVKIDIEGSELPALRGLAPLLDAHPPRAVYAEVNSTTRELIRFFADRGYRLWGFHGPSLLPLSEQRLPPDDLDTGVFASDPDEVARVCAGCGLAFTPHAPDGAHP